MTSKNMGEAMDLVDCDDISEDAILNELKRRFQNDIIYSSIGPIIIALNPYKSISNLYSVVNMQKYLDVDKFDMNTVDKQPPHIWTISQIAFINLKEYRTRQAIVISGESGAGKTEATKKCLQYLSAVAHNVYKHHDEVSTVGVPVEERVLDTNPILESFGNSKTARNNNSSRFGKWLEISFVQDPHDSQNIQLVGANITQYLLEKSRVVVQSTEERNYHIFYQLCSDQSIVGLHSASQYRYLNQSGNVHIDGVNDLEEYHATLQSIKRLGISDGNRDTIFSALKAILLLGNVDFEAAAVDNSDSTKSNDLQTNALVSIASQSNALLVDVSTLLGLDLPSLLHSLQFKSLKIANAATTMIPLEQNAATDARNALAKEIYGRLFSHVVSQANESLKPTQLGASVATNPPPTGSGDLSIGLLDIFGFEKFKLNSFEQLCINYANEKLQQYFINYILKKELELYACEGIDGLDKVIPIDNTDVLVLIEDKRRGIFAKLNDELKTPQANDETFLKKVESEHKQKDGRFHKDVRMGKSQFEVRHFAGVIRYDVKGFMEKNRDKLYEHLEELLSSSTHDTFRDIMVTYSPAGMALTAAAAANDVVISTSGKSDSNVAAVTISSRFTSQLNKLMTVLESATPHFIKCIKPNNTKAPNSFDTEMILLQLRYSGTLEAIQIRKSGYPTRRSHKEFKQAYMMFSGVSPMSLVTQDDAGKCRIIVERLGEMNPELFGDIKVGQSLVFLKSNVIQHLEREKALRGLPAVLYLQNAARRRLVYRNYVVLCKAREQLRTVMVMGKLMNSSNIDAIPLLTAEIRRCKYELHMNSFIVRDAEILLTRLHEVKDVLTQIKTCLSVSSSDGGYADVISEFSALDKVIRAAESLDIAASQLVDIRSRVTVLNDRAQAVLRLRSAIEQGDEQDLDTVLIIIGKLKSAHGVFCDRDEALGKDFQLKIKDEKAAVAAAIEQLIHFQKDYMSYLKNMKVDDTSGREAFLTRLIVSTNSAVSRFIAPLIAQKPVSPMSELVAKLISSILRLHDDWSKQHWSGLVAELIQVESDCKHIIVKNAALLKPSATVAQLEQVVHTCQLLTDSDLNRYFILPLLSTAVEKGRFVGEPGQVDYSQIDAESLAETVESIKHKFEFCVQKLQPLFSKLEFLVELRRLCIEGQMSDVLHMTSTLQQSAEIEARRNAFITSLQKHKGDVEIAQNYSLSEHSRQLSTQHASMIKSNLFASLPSEFLSLFALIDSELQLMHVESLDRQIGDILHSSISIASLRSKDEYEGADEDIISAVTSAPLNLALQDVQYIVTEDISRLGIPFKQTMVLIQAVEMLAMLRDVLLAREYGEIFEMYEKKQLFVLKDANESEALCGDHSVYRAVHSEMMRIVCIAFNNVGITELSQVIAEGAMQGKLGCKDPKSADVNKLKLLCEHCGATSTELLERGYISDELLLLIKIANALLKMRLLFLNNDDKHAVKHRKAALNELREFSDFYAFPANLDREIVEMSHELDYAECCDAIIYALDMTGQDARYLLPKKAQRKQTMASMKGRQRTASTSDMSNASLPSIIEVDETAEDLVTEDDLMLNVEFLDSSEVITALNRATEFQNSFEDPSQLPEQFTYFIEALTYIQRLRQSVLDNNWSAAQSVLGEITESNLMSHVPCIKSEISQCSEHVNNYAVISACKNVFGKAFQPQGTIGQMNYKALSMEILEETILLCQTTVCTSSRAQALFQALLVIADLRRAQKNGDWGGIKTVLARAEKQGIGAGFTKYCENELSRSTIDKNNYEAIQLLKRGILNEETVAKCCLLENASIQELTEAHRTVIQLNDSDRGAILKSLIVLAEALLKTRKAAIQKQWPILEYAQHVVKDSLESLKTEVEKFDKGGMRQKSMRVPRATVLISSSSRQSMLLTAPPESPKPSETSPVESPRTSTMWDEYVDLNACVNREVKVYALHFEVSELDDMLNTALLTGGITAERVGTVDVAQIAIEDLVYVLAKKAELEKGHTLPPAFLARCDAATLILGVRKAVLEERWKDLGIISDEYNLMRPSVPEHCRVEMNVVRLEVENKRIIECLQEALHSGRLEGEVGKAQLKSVNSDQLMVNINYCKQLTPRTEVAQKLLQTAEALYALRKLITVETVNWQQVAAQAKDVVNDVKNMKLNAQIMTEATLIFATAEDTILCDAMTAALEKGGLRGIPGAVSIDTVDLRALDEALQSNTKKVSVPKTARAQHLFTACRSMKSIREALLRTVPEDSDEAVEAWDTIRSHLAEILDIRRKEKADSSWTICREEISLLTKHAHIQNIRHKLLDTLNKTSHIYARRNSTNISDKISSEELLAESCEELVNIIKMAKPQEFDSDCLNQLVNCAQTLKQFRSAIVDEEWARLREMIKNKELQAMLKVIPEGKQEFSWISCETHNHSALEIIQTALQPVKPSVVSSSPLSMRSTTPLSGEFQNSTAAQPLDDHNAKLELALEEVRKYRITSKATLQLLECCTNVLLLRKSLRDCDYNQVAASFRWFRANVHLCPPHVQQEAQDAYVMHQNNLLVINLNSALQSGKASGQRGDLDVSTIDTDSLDHLMKQSKDVYPHTPLVVELLEAASIAQSIRIALKSHRMDELKDIIDHLAMKDKFSLLIVDEIATARAELDDEVVVNALSGSLRSFDDAESSALDLSFLNTKNSSPPSDTAVSDMDDENGGSSRPKLPGQSILASFSGGSGGSGRRYSFANKNNANIDPETIDTEILDRAIRTAEDHGVYSFKARRLFNTVFLIRALRATMKQSEWPKLEEILSEARYDEKVGFYYDDIANKEIQAIRSQLEMRAAVVDLSKALKIGWAKCNNGIVNTSQLCNDVLAHAIDRADKSIIELSGRSEMEAHDFSDMTPVQKQVQQLMTSAKLVLRIRDVLQAGNMEYAGTLAEEGLKTNPHYSVIPELTLYAKEINSALAVMKVFEALRDGMYAGQINELRVLLTRAKTFHDHYCNDLGLIRTLQKAECVYESLRGARQALIVALKREFNWRLIQVTVAVANRLHLQSPEMEQARERVVKIKEFELFVQDLRIANQGILADLPAYRQVLSKAAQLSLSQHPLAKHARTMLSFTQHTFESATLAVALKQANAFNIVTRTICIKRLYLELASSQVKYKLENFCYLRPVDEFGMRMNIPSEDLRRNMLFHSDQPLPTSLTKQSPVVAALSAWMFIHGVRAIERNQYSLPEIMLRKIVHLGRVYVPIRDELLLQSVKQIRNNSDNEASKKVWRILSCCLYFFPPSAEFESYLELFLLTCINERSNEAKDKDRLVYQPMFAKQCIRFMHQSIFKYGYDRRIKTRFDNSLEVMIPWLSLTAEYFTPHVDKSAPQSQTHDNVMQPNDSKTADASAKKPIHDIFINPSEDVAFPASMLAPAPVAPPTPLVETKPLPYNSITANVNKMKEKAAAAAAAALPPAGSTFTLPITDGTIVRGSRENWIARFKQLNNDFKSKEGGQMNKKAFAAVLANSISTTTRSADSFDMEILYFVLFGKHISNRRAISREYYSDEILFHSASEDESFSSDARRLWLEEKISVIKKSTELFFSQLKPSDLTLYAERFWDKVIDVMSTECLNFPFFKWEGGVRTKSIHPGKQVDVTISWELYREIILTGMKKYLEQQEIHIDGADSGIKASTQHHNEDIDLRSYVMHKSN